ncbi:hypothetical protein [Dactylosporangium sp. CA-139066]|uniref:hypothetical protein n=1 Tax=Dactylosporangium sp. CA-139066 TaxID=3239930 RepID=UPI003D8E012D
MPESDTPMNGQHDAISEPVVTPALAALRAALDHLDEATDRASVMTSAAETAAATRALVDAIALHTFPPEPGTDDRGEQVVMTVYGVDLSIRRRTDGVYVHIDSSTMPDHLLPLIGEFNSTGESVYDTQENR